MFLQQNAVAMMIFRWSENIKNSRGTRERIQGRIAGTDRTTDYCSGYATDQGTDYGNIASDHGTDYGARSDCFPPALCAFFFPQRLFQRCHYYVYTTENGWQQSFSKCSEKF